MARVAIPISKIATVGGLEKHSWQCAKLFAERGHDVTVLTTGRTGSDFEHSGVDVVSLGDRNALSMMHVVQFDRWCRQWLDTNPMDIVFGLDKTTVQTHYRATTGVHGIKLRQRRHYVSMLKYASFSMNPLHWVNLKFEAERFTNGRLRRVFPNSKMVQKEILAVFDFPEDRVEVVYNGVEWSKLAGVFEQWPESRAETMRDLDLDPDRLQLLFVGSGFGRKGVEPLLDALPHVKNKDFHLSVVGKDKFLGRYAARSQRLGLDDRVTFYGQRKDVSRFYQLADICIIPSYYDPCANVTLEALAMGVYVVSSRWNGAHEIMTPQMGSVIEDLLDPESVAASIDAAFDRRKTTESAAKIRSLMRSYEYDRQFARMLDLTEQDVTAPPAQPAEEPVKSAAN